MSAPQTNLNREARRHRPALIGMAIAVLIAVVAGVVLLAWPEPRNSAVQPPETPSTVDGN